MADWSVPTERENNLALAAGAKPGETVTINGNKVNVIAPATSPAAPDKKVANKRLDPHPPVGDPYLIQALTDAVGNYFARSIDKTALGTVKGLVNADGTYNAKTTDSTGTTNDSSQNGVKTKAASETKTVAGHKDSGVGGGARETDKKGKHKESDGAETGAVNGPTAKTTAQSAKEFAQGGNGPKVVAGDYTLNADGGGVHIGADKEITITAKGKNIGLTTKTGTITLAAGKNKITIGPEGIAINCATGPVLIFSDKGDVHIGAEKYASVTSYSLDVTLNAAKANVDILSSKVSMNATTSIYETVGGVNGKGISIKSDGVRITKDVHVGTTTIISDITSPISPKTKFI